MRYSKRLSFVFILFISFLLQTCTELSEKKVETDPFDGFPEYIERVMAQWNVPGMAIGVVKDNEVIYMNGFGYRDVENELPVTPQTLFGIGSCTKSFTAMAIGMLIDDEKLTWDTPMIEYLPDFRFYDEYATAHATIRDVLYHRTGLRGHNMVKNISLIDRQILFERLPYLKPSKGFRERFYYCNLIYQIAGYVVDRISNSSYEQFVTERIFEQLGMKNSTFSLEHVQRSANVAKPYLNFSATHDKWDQLFDSPSFFSINNSYGNVTAPSGGIYSCVEDMVEWLKLHLNGGQVGKQRIISARNLRYMHTPSMGLRYDPDDQERPISAYGMGWYIESYRGYHVIRHGGQLDGFMAQISFMPFEEIGVVVLTNMYYHNLPTIVSANIYDRLLGLKVIERSTQSFRSFKNAEKNLWKRNKEFWDNRQGGTNPAHPLDEFDGIYENPGYGRIVVKQENDELHVVFKNVFTALLKHFNGNSFATESEIWDYNHLMFHFHVNESGEIDTLAIPLESSVDDIVFTRVKDE